MLSDEFTAVSLSRDREELFWAVLRFAHHLEFDTMTATVALDRTDADPTFTCVDNAPAGYADQHADLAEARRDPVRQHCKTSSIPIVWTQETYVTAGNQSLPRDASRVTRMAADLQLFTVLAQEAAFRVLIPEVQRRLGREDGLGSRQDHVYQ